MRTTIELSDQLLTRARTEAAAARMSLKEFFIEAIEQRLAGDRKKTRRPPPSIGSATAPRIGVLTDKQIDEAMFG